MDANSLLQELSCSRLKVKAGLAHWLEQNSYKVCAASSILATGTHVVHE